VATLHLLRVFCSEDGSGGNPLAVFLDGEQIPADRRQEVARDLGLSETVFVDDAARGEMRIFTPAVELDFAGHPSVGTAWLLAEQHGPVSALHPPAGEVPVRYDGGLSFIAGRPEWPPTYDWVRLGSPEEVEALDGPPAGHDMVGAWAWIDEESGAVRSRMFPVRIGIAEDEATGAAAVQLGARLGRAIDIRQGRGSRILAQPRDDGSVEIGGLSVLDEVREYPLPGGGP
jgi:predicted PhzF superfamily epimerase YddE/YHI9